VQVEDLQGVGTSGSGECLDRGVLAAPAFLLADRQIDISLPEDRIAAESGIAIPPLAETDIVSHSVVGVTQGNRQFLGQVQLP